MKKYLGIDIGGTNTKIGLTNEEGKLLDFTRFSTPIDESFSSFCDLIHQATTEINPNKDFTSVGVGAPNVNPTTGLFQNPVNLPWDRESLAKGLKPHFSCPIHIQNDANIAAVGEKIYGLGRELSDFAVITLGTGVGSGLILNGQLYTGHNALATEAGHMNVTFKNGRPCGCGGVGHLEAYAGVKGILKTYEELADQKIRFRDLLARLADGEENAKLSVTITAQHIAKGLAQIISFICPQSIILAGGVSLIGDPLLTQIYKQLDTILYPTFKDMCLIQLSEIAKGEGAVLGAAAYAQYRCQAP